MAQGTGTSCGNPLGRRFEPSGPCPTIPWPDISPVVKDEGYIATDSSGGANPAEAGSFRGRERSSEPKGSRQAKPRTLVEGSPARNSPGIRNAARIRCVIGHRRDKCEYSLDGGEDEGYF